MAGFSLICCVVSIGEASRVWHIAKENGVKGATISIGKGTVFSPLMNILGINEERKEIVNMIVENELSRKVLKCINDEMRFDRPHHGIGFIYNVHDFIGSRNPIKASKMIPGGKNMYKIIFVVVEKGRGDEVIEAANKVTSTGGTIINARGAGVHEIQKFFSMEIEPEKEEVFIVTKKKYKDQIIQSIREHLKIDEPGNGILYVLDVNEVHGIQGF